LQKKAANPNSFASSTGQSTNGQFLAFIPSLPPPLWIPIFSSPQPIPPTHFSLLPQLIHLA
jgi:hypothetical protein